MKTGHHTILKLVSTAALLLSLYACSNSSTNNPSTQLMQTKNIKAPVADKKPQELVTHNHKRIDDYFWMRDDKRENPAVIAYLEAENAYREAVMAGTEAFQETLYQELVGRIKEDDQTAPVYENGYWYYRRYQKGLEHPIYARRQGDMNSAEEIMIDVNHNAKNFDYYQVRGVDTSFDSKIMSYGEDTVSRRQYDIRFKDLTTGKMLDDVLKNTTGSVAWAADNKTVFYTRRHPTTLLAYQIYKHVLGTDPANDSLIYEEKDTSFYTNVYTSKSKKYIVIQLESTVSAEFRILPTDDTDNEFQIFIPREKDHLHLIEHVDDTFYIISNWQARNYRLMKATLENSADKSKWIEVIPHREDTLIGNLEVYKNHLVIEERNQALNHIRIIDLKSKQEHYLKFDEPVYTATSHSNPEIDTTKFRYEYSSLTTPTSVYEYDMTSRSNTLVKQSEVLGGFDKNNYVTERQWATARDGAKVPISIVYRKGFKKNSDNPMLVYAYGSYGAIIDPVFSSKRLSLLDRGFVYALVHIRGGQAMGRQWYDDGRLLKKKNSFHDFNDATEFLVKQGYSHKDKVFAMGGSAGGLLMGGVVNMRPDLYRGVVAAVPFVDVVTTMLDESIPLTTNEFDEWGNPKNKEYYDYMLSYSPYDQVSKQAYPNILVTTGLWDSQVQYWEPAKWVAKLREYKTDDNVLLLYTNMSTGHGGLSGRYEALREDALEYAFMLDLLGIDK